MISRREAIMALGAATLGGVAATVAKPAWAIPDGQGGWPWKAQKLDPKESAEYAYRGFYNQGQGCCYGVFKGLVGLMGKRYGAPYNTFPLQMMAFGASGVSNWGTLCGSLNGAAAAFGLFWNRNEQEPLVDALFSWYEEVKLPLYKPAKPVLNFKVQQTIPKSTLCHVSVSKWSQESGHEMHSKERSERCARVTADVAQKAAELINAKLQGKLAPAKVSQARQSCMQCHDKGKEADIAKGKMNCFTCHDGHLEDMRKEHN
ncbi:MAG: C-GCAxxG-C-C family protein [Desulfarculaceae bacterium]